MSDVAKYRSYAQYCLDLAEKAPRSADRNLWRGMAQTWLGMIPERQLTAADRFAATVHERGAGQEPSTSEH
jgi:hypothetical protein